MTNGGKDCGAVNSNLNLYEKDLTLKLALETERQLKEQGINVVMTRRTDTTMNYVPRYQLENNNNCDLAISLHLNSCAKPNTARGCEIWLHSRANRSTQAFAKSVLNEILTISGTKNRGVKQGYPGKPNLDFWCNRLTKSMSMLIEIGFVNSDEDTRLVISCLKQYAQAVTKAVCRQLGINYAEPTTDKPITPPQTKPINIYDFEVNNLNDTNLAFLLNAKMINGETLKAFLDRQGYRAKVNKR